MAKKKLVTVVLDDLRELGGSADEDQKAIADSLLFEDELNARNTNIIHNAAKIALEDADILDELAEMGHAEDDLYAARSYVGDLLDDPDGPSINGF